MRFIKIKDVTIAENELFDWCIDHIEGAKAEVVPEKEHGPDNIIQDAVIEQITAHRPKRNREKHIYVCAPKLVAKQKEEQPVAEVEPVHRQDESVNDI